MIWIGGMIEYGDAKRFASKRSSDIAPRGALLFAFASAHSIEVQVCAARIESLNTRFMRE